MSTAESTDIGNVERGRVIDAVAHEAHDMLLMLERANDPLLVRR
jgi:hypothetical protein